MKRKKEIRRNMLSQLFSNTRQTASESAGPGNEVGDDLCKLKLAFVSKGQYLPCSLVVGSQDYSVSHNEDGLHFVQ